MPVRVIPITEPLPGGAPVLVARDSSCDLTVIAVDKTRTPWTPANYALLNALLAAVEAPPGSCLRLVS